MTNEELQSYLRSLTPDVVESIEVITNPSSKYDAEYKGIIDIRLKEDKYEGWTGNLTSNWSRNKFTYSENNLNLSYKKNKINYIARIAYEDGKNNYQYNAWQYLANSDYLRTTLLRYTKVRSFNLNSGIEYAINNNQKIGLMFRGNINNQNRLSYGSLLATDRDDALTVFDTQSNNPVEFRQYNFGTTLDYSIDFTNSILSFSGNYLSVENRQKDVFINTDKLNGELLENWKSDMTNKIRISTAQIDYGKKFGNHSLDFGTKYSQSVTDNNIQFETLSSENIYVPDATRSNVFRYKEQIMAGYVSFSGKFGKLQTNAGFRLENTNSDANSATADSLVNRNYLKWLPSLDATYNINNFQQISISYSRKLTRPLFSQLNPFRSYFSSLNYWIGNPYLLPSTTDQFKVNYRNRRFLTSFSLGKEEDVIIRYPIYHPDTNILEYLGANIPYRKFAILELNFPVKIAKWWSVNNQFSGFYDREYRPYLNKIYNVENFSYNLRINQTFNLPWSVTANLFMNYESKSKTSLYDISARSNVDISFQKFWHHKKLNTKLSFNDIFNTSINQLDFRDKKVMDNRLRHWFGRRQVVLGLTYNFGENNGKIKEQIKIEEENRAIR